MGVFTFAFTFAFILRVSTGYNLPKSSPTTKLSRRQLFQEPLRFLPVTVSLVSTLISTPSPSQAKIEIHDSSTSQLMKQSFTDVIDILSSQRIACDNIKIVILDGNINEAAFKIKQLRAQTELGGTILLESIQGTTTTIIATGSDATNAIAIKRMENKFATLLELISDSEVRIQKSLMGKYGSISASQVRLLIGVDDVINAFDDFFFEFTEDPINSSL